MLRKMRRPILLLLITCSACGATLPIKTWILASKSEHALARYQNGQVNERKAYEDADLYRCYSPEDDQAWRIRMAQLEACCPNLKVTTP